MGGFRNNHSSSSHSACPEMPLFRVIPNLFRDPVLILSALRLMGMRPRTEALRGGSMGESRDDTAKRHPDNAPGQDPCRLRKRDRREENRQSLFSLSSSRERSERLVPRVNLPPQPSDLGFSCNLNAQRRRTFDGEPEKASCRRQYCVN